MNCDIVIIIILVVNLLILGSILYINYNKNNNLKVLKEKFSTESDEAVQNIASLYNQGTLTVTSLNVTGAFNLLPTGIIVAWSGTTVPTGWVLCDGNNGTPNLANKFILGGPPYGQTGGAWTYTLTASQLPNHTHSVPQGDTVWNNGSGNGYWGPKQTGATGNCKECGGQPYNVAPPYYSLAYIMKT
jgi:hypothetical protein